MGASVRENIECMGCGKLTPIEDVGGIRIHYPYDPKGGSQSKGYDLCNHCLLQSQYLLITRNKHPEDAITLLPL